MGRHLNTAKVYTKLPNGTNKMLRVSVAYEAQFPRKYRQVLASEGASKLVAQLRVDKQLSLSAAWELLKAMCNN